jgi:hypothetical protein
VVDDAAARPAVSRDRVLVQAGERPVTQIKIICGATEDSTERDRRSIAHGRGLLMSHNADADHNAEADQNSDADQDAETSLRGVVTIAALATGAFAALTTAVTVGASYARFHADADAAPGIAVALRHYREVVAAQPSRLQVYSWADIGPARLDLDLGAAAVQVAAATTAFGVLLGIACLLAVRGQGRFALLAAALPALSVATMGGPLARMTPMISVRIAEPDVATPGGWPPALQPGIRTLLAAIPVTDTPIWWNALVSLATGVIALAAVALVRRSGVRRSGVPGRPHPALVGAVLVLGSALVALAVQSTPDDVDGRPGAAPAFVLMTGLIVLVTAVAAATSRAFPAVVMALGMLAVHYALFVAWNRDSGAPGGWGVGTGGAQQSATWVSAAILIGAPLVAWGLASLMAVERRWSARRATPSARLAPG